MVKRKAEATATTRKKNRGIKAIPPTSSADEAVVYAESGISGEALSTISGVKSAQECFNKFLDTKKMKTSQELKQSELCSIKLFREYGIFLTTLMKMEIVSIGTAKQYLSGAKSIAMKRFPDWMQWNDDINGGWYRKLRSSMIAVMTRLNLEMGLLNCFKAPSIGRSMLKKIGTAFLQKNSIDAVVKRSKLMMTFFAAGRSGELANTKWTDTAWDYDDENFQFLWHERKTLASKIVPVFHDNSSFEICFYHSLACYLIVGGNGIRSQMDTLSEQYIFPDMKTAGDTCINSIIQELIPREDCSDGKVLGLHPASVGKSLRKGAANLLIRKVGIITTTLFANWDCNGYTSLYEYIGLEDDERRKAALALANHRITGDTIYPPDCGCVVTTLSPEDRIIFSNLLRKLFNLHLSVFKGSGNLVGVPYYLFAIIMFHHKSFIADYPDHVIVKSIKDTLKSFDIKYSTYLHWCDLVVANYNTRNSIECSAESSGLAACITASNLLATANNQQIGKLQSQFNAMNNVLAQLHEDMQQMVNRNNNSMHLAVPMQVVQPTQIGQTVPAAASTTSSSAFIFPLRNTDNTLAYHLKGDTLVADFFYDYYCHGLQNPSLWTAASRNIRTRANATMDFLLKVAYECDPCIGNGLKCKAIIGQTMPSKSSMHWATWDSNMKNCAMKLTVVALGILKVVAPIARGRRDSVSAVGRAYGESKENIRKHIAADRTNVSAAATAATAAFTAAATVIPTVRSIVSYLRK